MVSITGYNGINVSTILNKDNYEKKQNATYHLKNLHETVTHKKTDLAFKRKDIWFYDGEHQITLSFIM